MDLVTPVVAGAAGALMKEVATKGVDWVIALVASHSSEVQAKAQENAQNFMIRLARRVETLEAEIPIDRKYVFEDALGHPGTSLLMQKALLGAAATNNDDRHEILSELIAQRLTAGADDLISLVGGAACDVVSALSSRHIRLLGVLAVLFEVRPTPNLRTESQSEYDARVMGWWDCNMRDLCTPDLRKVHLLDLRHLVGLSCIALSIGVKDFAGVCALRVEPIQFKPDMSRIESFVWWPTMDHLWKIGVRNASLTSLGSLIGVLYRDSVLKTRTSIEWDDPPEESPPR